MKILLEPYWWLADNDQKTFDKEGALEFDEMADAMCALASWKGIYKNAQIVDDFDKGSLKKPKKPDPPPTRIMEDTFFDEKVKDFLFRWGERSLGHIISGFMFMAFIVALAVIVLMILLVAVVVRNVLLGFGILVAFPTFFVMYALVSILMGFLIAR
jgi:hypothetical protein